MRSLQYPIGEFEAPKEIGKLDISIAIKEIEVLPQHLRDTVKKLTDSQLDTPYRPDGWTIRQVVHHIPESHMNSYIRFKWALTENTPIIKAYDEKGWSVLEDNLSAPIQPSLDLLAGLHAKWVILLRSLKNSQWNMSFIHPETDKEMDLKTTVLSYAWHGKHHLAHIKGIIKRSNW